MCLASQRRCRLSGLVRSKTVAHDFVPRSMESVGGIVFWSALEHGTVIEWMLVE